MVRVIAAVLLVALSATSCGSSTAGADVPDTAVGEVAVEVPAGDFVSSYPCSASSYPNDPEFRNLVCEVQGMLCSIFRVGVDVDPDWTWRQAEATLLYAEDRGAALQQLRDLIGEMRSAGLG